MKTVKTPKGTELPLVNLKGKDYLMVAHRLQWLNEAADRFTVQTELIKVEKDESVVRATVSIINNEGNVVKSATATKREDSKGFGDHLEKAETGAIGRCLALLGYGTQFALSDLDEGDRIVDSPVVDVKTSVRAETKLPKPEFISSPAADKLREEQKVISPKQFKLTPKPVSKSDDI